MDFPWSACTWLGVSKNGRLDETAGGPFENGRSELTPLTGASVTSIGALSAAVSFVGSFCRCSEATDRISDDDSGPGGPDGLRLPVYTAKVIDLLSVKSQ